jgi:predicted DNA-binding protein with PD1-like motif
MQILKPCAWLGLAAAFAHAQQTTTVMPVHPDPVSDSKPNSDRVPDAYAISGEYREIVVFRLKYQTDLLDGIEKRVKSRNIHNAVMLATIGSVRNHRFHDTGNRSLPTHDTVVGGRSSPADILSMNGYVIDGRVHTDITMANPKGAFGGHPFKYHSCPRDGRHRSLRCESGGRLNHLYLQSQVRRR